MFDEFRIKSILKKNLSKEDYLKLSDKIRFDSRVIEHLIKCDPEGINLIDRPIVKKLVLNDYSLVKYLDKDKLNFCFHYLDWTKVPIDKNLFDKLEKNVRKWFFRHSPKLYFNLLPQEDRASELCECISDYYYFKFVNREFDVSIEEINEIVLELNANQLVELFKYNDYVISHIAEIIKNYDFDEMLKL